MENHRLLLYFTLFFIVYLLWAQWQIDYGPQPETTVTQQTIAKDDVPGIEAPTIVPEADMPAMQTAVSVKEKTVSAGQRIHVITDLVDAEIDTRGGDIRRVMLRQYAVVAEKPEEKLVFLTDSEVNYHVAQSGLVSVNKTSAPTHNEIYSSEKTLYRLGEGESELTIPLHWVGEDGVRVTKTYTFHRGDYTVDVSHRVTAGQNDWSGSQYLQLVRAQPSDENASSFIHTYTGGVIYNDEIKYEKYDFDDIAEKT